MPEIDVNAFAAARREELGEPEPVTVTYKDKVWTPIIDEVTYDFAEWAAAGQYRLAIYEMLGAEVADEFFAMKPKLSEVTEVVEQISSMYTNRALGNSSASKSSSASTSRPSKSSSPSPTPDSPPSPSSSGDPDA
jgi:hypothetical protein